MAIAWTDDLSVGINEIDTQHKELFRQIELLHTAMTEGKGKNEVDRVLSFLAGYVVKHFGAEEQRMLSANYPLFSVHKSLHEGFVADFGKLKCDLDQSGPSSSTAIQINRYLNDWLKTHIRNTDTQLAGYLKPKN